MRNSLCLALLWLMGCAGARGQPLKYRLQVSPEVVRVELEVRGRSGELLAFQVPDSLDGSRFVSDVEAWDGAGQRLPVHSRDAHHWECRMPREGFLRLSYRVEVGAPGLAPNAPGAGEMPKLEATHVFLPGAEVLLAPSAPDAVRGPIPVEWQVPPGWRVLTPFGPEAPGLDTLLDNYLVAGTFSRVPVEVAGGLRLEVAWLGAGDVAHSALRRVLPRVFGGAVGLMGGRAPVSPYVVLLRPDYPSGLMQGTPRQGSLQVHLPREVTLERAHEGALLSTLAHEYLHTWGRDSKAELRLLSGPEPGGEMRWFIEGFVNYLAQLALLEGCAQDRTSFLSSLGRAYAAVERHPGYGHASLAQASARFFEDPASRAFSYSGGMVVAFLSDLELRRQGKGTLADFLARVPPGRLPMEWKDWLAAWIQHTGRPEPVASWVRTAGPLPFLDFVRGAGGVVREQERWLFDVGFDVRPEGLAVASVGPLVGAQGLARGDVVVSVEGRTVSSVEAFLQALPPTGAPVGVQLLRGGVPRALRLHRAFQKDHAINAEDDSVLGRMMRGCLPPL